MKASGKTTRLMDKANSITLTEMFTKVNGLMIKLADRVPTLTKTEPNMLANGKMISKTALALSNGSMDKFMKGNTKMEPKQEKESLNL